MTTSEDKKHACPDCRQCQNCSPARCHLCRGQGAEEGERRFAGVSMAQQIALFEAVNREERPEGDYRPALPLLRGPLDS
ncbi:MAG: hypothetical protein V1806_09515 [Pseudomonadota bacterium]